VPFPRHAALRVLDVAAGHGRMSRQLLDAFPNATVTLVDYSPLMLAEARRRLAAYAARTRFLGCGIRGADWTRWLSEAIDVAVSGIAIHDLVDYRFIADVYRAIHDALAAGGILLNLDYVRESGGIHQHLGWLSQAGFARVVVEELTDRLALLGACKQPR